MIEKMKEIVLSHKSKFERHPRICCLCLKQELREKLQVHKDLYRFSKSDSLLLYIESKTKTIDGFTLNLVLSERGISIYPEKKGLCIFWEEIEKSEVIATDAGKFLFLYFSRFRNIYDSYNLDLLDIYRNGFWEDVSVMINEIIESFPSSGSKVISRMLNVYQNEGFGSRYQSLKDIYSKDFTESMNYKMVLHLLSLNENK